VDTIDEKIGEARFFLHAMEHYDGLYVSRLAKEHPRHNGVIDLMRPPNAELRALAKNVQYSFSAFLSAHRSVWLYIRERAISTEAKPWRARVEARDLLEALRLLRNSDIHQGIITTATRFRIGQVVDAGAGHLHVELANAAVSLSIEALLELKQLRDKPLLAWLLASEPIVKLADRGLAELAAIATEGREAGYY
jgi:hypothetical protein